jgi:hypothetical protein
MRIPIRILKVSGLENDTPENQIAILNFYSEIEPKNIQ